MRWQNDGITRLWGFDDNAALEDLIPNFPATDTPFELWYDILMDEKNAPDWSVQFDGAED